MPTDNSFILEQLRKAREPKPKKEKKPLRRVGLKKQAAEKIFIGDEETQLQKWYQTIMDHEMPVCWETGDKIDIRDKKGWQGSIAHVLPKSLFDSVKTHPMNYMILKMWGGTHGQYDSSWENAAKMKVWPHAVKIFNILYPLLTREEKAKLPDIIIQEIKPELYNQ